jgi:hypothetical protein
MSSTAHMTECGLPGIKDIPYGVHMCHFYEGREDLAAMLVPYFAAGLRNHERCIWVTAAPLDAVDAQLELQKAGMEAQSALQKGALTIREHSEWYADAGTLEGGNIVERWLAEEQRALAEGYNGLRITGNVTFVTPEAWPVFMEYEDTLNNALHGRRIVALCSYQLGRCGAPDVLDVVRRHHCTLDRPDHGWQLLTSPQRQSTTPNRSLPSSA